MNKKSICHSDLRMRILSQDIAPGSGLDEVSLSAQYEISRTPLREILHRLAGEGYVEIEENRGARVASMDLPVMRVFFQTAPLVYSTVARLAAENRTGQQIDRLKATQVSFTRARLKRRMRRFSTISFMNKSAKWRRTLICSQG